MKWLARIFANAIARRVAYVVVALLMTWCGVGNAHAQTKAEARALCEARPNTYEGHAGVTSYRCLDRPNEPPTTGKFEKQYLQYGTWYNESWPGNGPWDEYRRVCALGQSPDPVTGECSAPSDECDPGQGKTEDGTGCEDCLSRNGAAQGFPDTPTTKPFAELCLRGCQLGKAAGTKQGKTTVDGVGNGAAVFTGVFQFTGSSCGLPPNTPEPPPEPNPPKKQECIAAGSAQTYCQKNTGEMCYAVQRTGKQVCWNQGETGQKTDGDTMQERTPGDAEAPSTRQLPSGETGNKEGPTTVTRTTTTNPDGTTTTTITATTNYVSPTGNNAGRVNQGEPRDGSGGRQPGQSEEGEENASSGGGDCSTPPTSSGDPILGNILTQTWHTRCSTNNKVEGGSECGTRTNPTPPPICAGDKALCRIAQEARAQRCLGVYDRQDAQADAAEPGADDTMPSIWSTDNGEPLQFNSGLINLGAGDGNLFPEFEIEGTTFSMPQVIYDYIALIKWLVIAAFTLWGMFIAGGSNRT